MMCGFSLLCGVVRDDCSASGVAFTAINKYVYVPGCMPSYCCLLLPLKPFAGLPEPQHHGDVCAGEPAGDAASQQAANGQAEP